MMHSVQSRYGWYPRQYHLLVRSKSSVYITGLSRSTLTIPNTSLYSKCTYIVVELLSQLVQLWCGTHPQHRIVGGKTGFPTKGRSK